MIKGTAVGCGWMIKGTAVGCGWMIKGTAVGREVPRGWQGISGRSRT